MEAAAKKQILVVAGLLTRGDEWLACQRHERGAFPLKWEFPGGKLENGESDLAGLRRELKEELDITVHDATEIFRHQHDYPDGPTVSLRFFKVSQYGGALINRVFQQIKWVKSAELDGLDFLDGDRPLIAKLVAGGRR